MKGAFSTALDREFPLWKRRLCIPKRSNSTAPTVLRTKIRKVCRMLSHEIPQDLNAWSLPRLYAVWFEREAERIVKTDVPAIWEHMTRVQRALAERRAARAAGVSVGQGALFE